MILKIVKYPEAVLSQPGEPVTEFNAELRKLVADMFETTYASQGVGLAAPQVGASKRVTVIDLSMGKEPKDKLVLVNPEIVFQEGKQYEEEAASAFLISARKWRAPPKSASAPRTSAASGSRRPPTSCFRAAFSMRSTTSTACCSSSA